MFLQIFNSLISTHTISDRLSKCSQQHLEGEAVVKAKNDIEVAEGGAIYSYQSIMKTDSITIELLDAVDKFYIPEEVDKVIESSDPAQFPTPYMLDVCRFGSMLGQLFIQNK